MSLRLRLADNDAHDRIAQMMGPYLNDLGAPAGFIYPHLDAYWKEASRYPYLITHGDQLVGFALVHRINERPTYELVEFYIAAQFRKRGFGREAAEALFKLHPGTWSVAVRSDNAAGGAFWDSVFAGRPWVTSAETTQPNGIVYTFASGEACDA